VLAAFAIAFGLFFVVGLLLKRRSSGKITTTPVAPAPPAEATIYFLDTYRQRRTDATRHHRASHSAS
jgi:hypothetical protein